MSGPFGPSAEIYDFVYRHLDYEASAALVASLIRERNPGARSLLDMSCGTGLHLAQWRSEFDEVQGADIDPAMLAVSRERLGEAVTLHQADYVDFDLDRTFDAVTCLFSSIGYVETALRLDRAVASMAAHLDDGGVLVVEPWLLPHMIQPPYVRTHTVESPDMVVTRHNTHRYDGDEGGGVSDMEFGYLVTTESGSKFFTEAHVMGVFTPARYVAAFERAGLETEFLDAPTEIGRGLVVGVRR